MASEERLTRSLGVRLNGTIDAPPQLCGFVLQIVQRRSAFSCHHILTATTKAQQLAHNARHAVASVRKEIRHVVSI